MNVWPTSRRRTELRAQFREQIGLALVQDPKGTHDGHETEPHDPLEDAQLHEDVNQDIESTGPCRRCRGRRDFLADFRGEPFQIGPRKGRQRFFHHGRQG